MNHYRWKKGTRSGVSAQAFGEWQEAMGVLTAQEVVKAARSKKCPIHSAFQWDDKKAGHEYRLWQARSMLAGIQVIRVKVTSEDKEPDVIRVHVRQHVPDVGYVSEQELRENPDYRSRAIGEVLSKLAGLRERYIWLNELNDLWDSIDRAASG